MKINFLLPILLLTGTLSEAQYISTFAGTTNGFSGDGGAAVAAKLSGPAKTVADASGNVYICDNSNDRVRKVSSSGVITTVAGNGSFSVHTGDGGPATAAGIGGLASIALDAAGNLYIAQSNADTFGQFIRKVNTAGVITTIAGGTGAFTYYHGDGGPASAAGFSDIADIATDINGNLYIVDALVSRIRKIDTSGMITTIAGNSVFGFLGDGGPATAAELAEPSAVTVDWLGNVYIADMLNNRIRKISTDGVISTIAGTGTAGFSGDGGPATAAELNYPMGLSVDQEGQLFFADNLNNRIRLIFSGYIYTAAGNGTAGYTGDLGPATAAELNQPEGVCVVTDGPSEALFIADYSNNVVRRVMIIGEGVQGVTAPAPSMKIWPVPAEGNLTLLVSSVISEPLQIMVMSPSGDLIKTISANTNIEVPITLETPSGVYIISATFGQHQLSQVITKE